MEDVVLVLLLGKRVLDSCYPVLEGGKGEQLVARDVVGEIDGALGRRVGKDEG